MRILCYAQNLIGVGHFVRMLAIARGLGAAAHEVHLVDGGRAVPRREGPFDPNLVTLPRLVGLGGRLAAEEDGNFVVEVLAERTRRLTESATQIRPDVVLVDHYPFGRWELDAEIGGAITAARRANAGVRIVCSVRDNLRSNYRRAEQDAHEVGVLARLREFFDDMLIHTDPGFARLEDSFTPAEEIALPRRYTGVVVDRSTVSPDVTLLSGPYTILSCGGSTTNLEFLLAAVEAIRRLRARGALGRSRFSSSRARSARPAPPRCARPSGTSRFSSSASFRTSRHGSQGPRCRSAGRATTRAPRSSPREPAVFSCPTRTTRIKRRERGALPSSGSRPWWRATRPARTRSPLRSRQPWRALPRGMPSTSTASPPPSRRWNGPGAQTEGR